MGPPLGRLRVLQSLEVDEDDAEYQRKKREAQQTLKNTFESIFEKYSNVADHETDEVDLNTGKIVVDNGHMRSLANDPKARERWRAVGEIMEGGPEEDEDSDSVDELAEPAMPPITIRRKAPSTESGSPQAQPLREDIQFDVTSTSQIAPNAPPLTLDPTQLLSTLIQLPQISQQPALSHTAVNPEHQNAFLMGLGQSVWQTITQSLAQTSPSTLGSAFGGILSSPAIAPAPRVTEMPASDPKWQYPPLPERPVRTKLPQSKPLSASTLGKRRAPFTHGHQREKVKRMEKEPLPVSATLARGTHVDEHSEMDRDDLDPAIQAYPKERTVVSGQEYHPGDEGLHYIEGQCKKGRMTVEQVKESRAAWKDWPLHVFRQHYLPHGTTCSSLDDDGYALDDAHVFTPEETVPQAQEPHAQTPRTTSQKMPRSLSPIKSSAKPSKKTRRTRNQDDALSETQNCAGGHLPTPNSISNSENTDTEKDNHQPEFPQAHLYEQNSELHVAVGDEHPRIEPEEPVIGSVPQEEIVLPSIESDEPEEYSQDELLEQQCPLKYPRVEVRIPRAKSPAPGWSKLASPRPLPSKCELPIPDHNADSDSDIDLVPTALPVEAGTTDPSTTVPSIDSEGEQPDELAAPFTPRIKREPVSPQPSFLLTIPRLSTPKSAPQLSRLDSSGSKSTSRLSKFHIARLARAQWAKKGHGGTPLRAKQRRSLGEAVPARKMQEESDDELAM